MSDAPTPPRPVRVPTAIIGLTGGIACGKSTVAARLRDLGALVIDADLVSREVTAPGQPALAAIERAFGPEVIGEDGALLRDRLGAIVFRDPARRRQLEAITHPAIFARTGGLLADAHRQGWAWVVYEAALILESRGKAGFHALAVVLCPREQQLARLMARSGLSLEEAEGRIAAQTDDATRRAAADFLIANDADLETLRARADELFATLCARYGSVPPAS